VGRGVGGVDARETVPVDRYDADELGRWVVEVLRASGIPLAHAESTARALVRTSIRGVDTHGVARLPSYVERI
jgi:LDH2 family malate/lactate/ureidoglycolate dehydrogenase